MNERQIEAALAGLSMQRPRAPTQCIEKMVQMTALFQTERMHRLGNPAELRAQPKNQLSAGSPVKDKNKTL